MSGRPAVDAAELLRVPFALTRTVRARQGSIRRLRVGKSENRRTWAFDLIINHQITGGTESIANNYSAGVVELAKRVDGRIGLDRNGLMRRAETLDAPEVSAGTEELRGVFTVRATSEDLAARVLDKDVCVWLVGSGRGFHYEIVHDRVLAYGWRRYLGGSGALKAALGLAAHIER